MVARSATDSRGVSETTGVATLIVLTVLVTASVGISVILVADEEAETQVSFQFDHLEDAGALLVTHDGGGDLRAGSLYIEGPDNNVTWATIAGTEEDAMVTGGDVIQVSSGSPYGSSVTGRDEISVVHVPQDGNRTVLATWPEEEEGGPGLGDEQAG